MHSYESMHNGAVSDQNLTGNREKRPLHHGIRANYDSNDSNCEKKAEISEVVDE